MGFSTTFNFNWLGSKKYNLSSYLFWTNILNSTTDNNFFGSDILQISKVVVSGTRMILVSFFGNEETILFAGLFWVHAKQTQATIAKKYRLRIPTVMNKIIN